jgi:hypothetical protein
MWMRPLRYVFPIRLVPRRLRIESNIIFWAITLFKEQHVAVALAVPAAGAPFTVVNAIGGTIQPIASPVLNYLSLFLTRMYHLIGNIVSTEYVTPLVVRVVVGAQQSLSGTWLRYSRRRPIDIQQMAE